MAIFSTRDSVQLQVVHPIYKTKTVLEKLPTGEQYPQERQVIHKQLRVRKWFRKDGITSVEEHVTAKNTIARSRSIVYDRYSGRFYATFHPAQQIIESIEPPVTAVSKIGFIHDPTTIHTRGPQVLNHQRPKRTMDKRNKLSK